MNEVRVLKGLRHHSIIAVEDVFMDDSSFYIIQALCEGGDLFERIVDRHSLGYPELSARALISRILEAVEFLHDNNIVHRDLKVHLLSYSHFRIALFSFFTR